MYEFPLMWSFKSEGCFVQNFYFFYFLQIICAIFFFFKIRVRSLICWRQLSKASFLLVRHDPLIVPSCKVEITVSPCALHFTVIWALSGKKSCPCNRKLLMIWFVWRTKFFSSISSQTCSSYAVPDKLQKVCLKQGSIISRSIFHLPFHYTIGAWALPEYLMVPLELNKNGIFFLCKYVN